jgi:hypothetical protein
MFGLVVGIGTSLLLATMLWYTGNNRSAPHECKLIQEWMAADKGIDRQAFGTSRPGQLISEIRELRDRPECAISVLNEVLGDVDFETRWTASAHGAYARISATAGIAGACLEITSRLRTSTIQAAVYAIVALMCGLLGSASCAVIGQWAIRGILRRRRLWDEFVQWILKSEFSKTAWSLRGIAPSSIQTVQDRTKS